MPRYDALIVGDPRFAGGTSASIATDVRALSALGAKVGLLHVRSRFLSDESPPLHRDLLALEDLPHVERVSPDSEPRASVTFFHNPLVFWHGIEERSRIVSDRSLVVAHQTPFRGDGSLEYDPVATSWRIRLAFGATPWWAPVSRLCRRQLRSFAPLIRLSSEDWTNLFDTDFWRARRPAFSGAGPPVVGRHGRDDLLKWPDKPADIVASLPAHLGWHVRVMGCPEAELQARGVDTSAWEILPFNGMPVRDYLESIDVFSYFYSERSTESFGRTVVEAALMERPCILDPRFQSTFGNVGTYCGAQDVAGALARFRDDISGARALASAAREAGIRRFSSETFGGRFERLLADPGDTNRRGDKVSGAMTLRKIAGLYRRTIRHAVGNRSSGTVRKPG